MEVLNNKGYLYGDLNFSFPCHMNYGKCFLDIIIKYGDKVAMVDGMTGEKITYNEMAHKIMKISMSFTRSGVKQGDVIGICSENRIEIIPTIIAILCSGAVATFFSSAYCKDEIIHVANVSKPKYVIFSSNAYKTHYSTLRSLNMIEHFYVYGDCDDKSPEVTPFAQLYANFVDIENYEAVNFYGKNSRALILYSSGTTGVPKGVNIMHYNYISTIFQKPVTEKPLTMLTVAPLTNTMGLIVVTDALLLGKTVVILSKFDEELYLKTIERNKVAMILVAPPTVITLCKSSIVDKYDLSSLELVLCGGAPLDFETIHEFRTRFPTVNYVLQGYGMTEAIGAITKETIHKHKQGSVGKVTAGAVVKIADIDTHKTLGPNQQGELCLSGPILFDGYVGMSRETDDEGFFKTGDVAYYDEDGFIYIVDRIKELIKYKAWQVSPAELEALLLQHPSVKDAAVIGVPNKLAGELPTAFIVKKTKATVSEQDIVHFIMAKVAPWKQLRGGVKFVNDIPKNLSGKILRRLLRQSLNKPVSKL